MAGAPANGLAVGLLGPLRVSVHGRPVELPAGRVRALLTVLAMSAGRPVSMDRLATAVWGTQPPGSSNARANVRTTVRRLRRELGAEWVGVRPGGYVLEAAPEQVDALRFVRLLDEAAAAPDGTAQRALLSDALRLWRGTPFDGVRSDWLEQEQALSAPLQERYLAALERRADLDLADGLHTGGLGTGLAAQLAELTELAGRFPLRESLWVRLLRLLQRSGRPAEALERYEQIRARLAEELGVDPGLELRQAYADLLAGRAPAPVPVAEPEPDRAAPRQLPTASWGFAGRHGELKMLDELLGERDGIAHPIVIATITGTAGVGKTTLAVHWAHRIADQFPDGQLYADLRGFDPSGRVAEPAEVLRGFLDALRVPPQQIPQGVAEQAALFRSRLAGTRTLVLLDNAWDAAQVGPLLPGEAGCLVVVTSRDQLTGLVAGNGAQPLGLDLLARHEARELLVHRLGHDRTAAEPDATEAILDRCSGLPLALAIVAARAATAPDLPLAGFAEQLRAAGEDLGPFTGGGASADLREIFAWSYQVLSPAAARLFRLTGLHPGPDISVRAAASLAAVPVPAVQSPLAELTRAHLLREHAPGRYVRHDLLAAYAIELAHRFDGEADRRAAIRRLLDHYLHTAREGAGLLHPHGEEVPAEAVRPGASPERLTGLDQALAWFTTEHPVLLAAVELAERAGFDRHVCQLARTLFVFLHRRGLWHERSAVQQSALAAARRLGDLAEQARAHRALAVAAADLQRYDEAQRQLDRALALAGDQGDLTGRAWALHHRSLVSGLQGRASEALEAAAGARDLFRRAGDRVGYAMALTDVGWYLGRVGDHQPALAVCEQALALHQELDNVAFQAHTRSCLGDIHHRRGDPSRAVASYRQALELFRRCGDRYGEASTLVQLGAACHAAGAPDAARDARRQARNLLDHLDPAAREQVWSQLRQLAPGQQPEG